MLDILESDAAFRVKFGKLPIVRASTYPRVRLDQEINLVGPQSYHSDLDFSSRTDPRRPVVMRGAKNFLNHKGRRISDYGDRIVWRYLRRVKFTSFDANKAHNFVLGVCRRVAKKFYYPTFANAPVIYDIEDDGRGRKGSIWLSGKIINVTDNQYRYLKRLWEIIEKTKKVESKMVQIQRDAA